MASALLRNEYHSSMTKFLVIRRDNIGDLVCTTPLFEALKARFPESTIHALVNSYNSAVLEGNPNIAAIHVYEKLKHEKNIFRAPWIIARRISLLAKLRQMGFDYAIIAGSAFQPRAVNYLRWIRPKHIIGYLAQAHAASRIIDLGLPLENAYGLHEVEATFRLLTKLDIHGQPSNVKVYPNVPFHEPKPNGRVDQARRIHQAADETRCAVFSTVDPLYLIHPTTTIQAHGPSEVSAPPKQAASNEPARNNQQHPLCVGVHISSRKPSQRWPEDNFVEFIRHLREQYAAKVLLFWSPGTESDKRHPGDDNKANAILTQLNDPAVIAMPTSTLRDLIDAMAEPDLFVCSDGGAMHIAAGLDKPILCFFGDSDASHWHPWGVLNELLQTESRVATDISVADAIRGFEKLLARIKHRMNSESFVAPP